MNTPRCIGCALALALAALCFTGCPSSQPGGGGTGGGGTGGTSGGDGAGPSASSKKPAFTLAWSEYPSWSVFGVADEEKLIDGDEGEYGPIEEKWGVDIVLAQADYVPCLTMFSSGQVDAVCITNTDVLAPALERSAVAVLPTSTSAGADACVAVGIDDVAGLQGVPVHGASLSVSEYCFERCLQLKGEDLSKYKFADMAPDAASAALASGEGEVKAIMVWNPFVMQVLKELPDAKRVFDSKDIPGEIVDMVVMGKDSLAKPGGADFACAVIDAFYQVSDRIEAPATRNDALVALGREFASLGVEEMEQIVEETQFYKTPEAALDVFTEETMSGPMEKIEEFCVRHTLINGTPKVAYGADDGAADLRFDPTYIQRVRDKE